MRAISWLLLTGVLAGAVLAAPASRPSEAAEERQAADLSRLVVVGDSLSAGFQNGSLHAAQQVHGYASLVAAQAGVDLPLPLIGAPGIPNVLTLVDPGPPPVVGVAPGASPGRLDPFTQPMNLAVPGHKVGEALALRPDCNFANLGLVLENLVLGLPGCLASPQVRLTQVEWAEALAPTTILVWLGSNDSLRAVTGGTLDGLTEVAEFEADYREAMDRLAATGATLVVANLPDVTVIPFLVPAREAAALLAAPLGIPVEAAMALLGVADGDSVTLRGLAGIATPPLEDHEVVTAAELAAIRAANSVHNAIVEAEAAFHGAALVDVRGILNRADARGVVINGQRLTTDFLGGAFSLDGLHPTNTGYAVIANAFIHALNRRFAAGIPPLEVRAIAREDPLVLPGVGRPPAAPGRFPAAAMDAVVEALD